jgi:hypothetical protein
LQITQRHLMSLSCSILECHNSPIPMCMLSFIFFCCSLYVMCDLYSSYQIHICSYFYIYLYLFVLFRVDSGVFAMMFLEHWHSPRSIIANLFKESDIPNIRIKLANDMVFSHKNTGNKGLVTSFNHKVLFCVFFSISYCWFVLFIFAF